MVSDAFKLRVYDSFVKYLGRSISDLADEFSIDSNAKSFLEMIVSRILGYSGKANSSLEMARYNVVVKTVRVQESGNVKESMSFPTFSFKEIVQTKWKDSDLRKMFLTQTFLFVVFSENDGDVCLSSIKFWNMPIEILECEVKNVWQKTVDVINSGDIVSNISPQKNGKAVVRTNFPGIKFNGVCHVRPHARNSSDTFELPVPDKLTGMTSFTKQCFWLNSSYIREIVK